MTCQEHIDATTWTKADIAGAMYIDGGGTDYT